MKKSGHCLCGAVSFEYEGPENWMGHCHCESCRRATASAFTSFLGVPHGAWSWTGKPPKTFKSSKTVVRSFCPDCGTQMAYEAEKHPDEIHFYAATLSDSKHYQPTIHFHAAEAVPWVQVEDDLKRKP